MHEDYRILTIPTRRSALSTTILRLSITCCRLLLAKCGSACATLLPYNRQDWETRSYTTEELRTSHLGQSPLTIADYAGGGYVLPSKVERAMKQVYRMLFGNGLTNGYTLPLGIHKTELGQLLNEVNLRMYGPGELMTPKQAYTTLGISRQSLYDRADEGRLQKINLPGGELRFLKAEIEEWKIQREHRQNRSKS